MFFKRYPDEEKTSKSKIGWFSKFGLEALCCKANKGRFKFLNSLNF
jgi:hypothetical protein